MEHLVIFKEAPLTTFLCFLLLLGGGSSLEKYFHTIPASALSGSWWGNEFLEGSSLKTYIYAKFEQNLKIPKM